MITNKIIKDHLCVGCGLCASVIGQDSCRMVLTDRGFYQPQLKDGLDDSVIKKLCPGIRVHSKKHSGVWGNVLRVSEGWAKDAEIRYKAASGGVVTSLALYLIESKLVDAILHVGVKDGSYLYNELKVSRNRQDVINNAQSRYAPALTLSNIMQIMDSTSDVFAFIGKPCDIAGVKNLISIYPQYDSRFRLFISIFCAGMPSYRATEKTWKQSGKETPPVSLSYRGEGWPGFFKARWEDGSEYKLSYNESWGKILGRDLGFRCKICPDGIGMLSDISVGDSWSTKNGYPDFTEKDGRCFVMVRTERGEKVFSDAEKCNYVVSQPLDINKIQEIQPYQYLRRKTVGWRILPVQIVSFGILDFKGLDYAKQALKSNYIEGIKNMRGTVIRMIKAILGG